MKASIKIYATLLLFFLTFTLTSQETITITEEKKTTLKLPKDYSKTLGLYIFPSKNQDSLQQQKDLKECLKEFLTIKPILKIFFFYFIGK